MASAVPPARQGTIPRLKRRAEFLKVAGAGRKFVAPGLILQVWRRDAAVRVASADGRLPPETAGEPIGAAPRIGYTASRKVGIAVARNRARRRLRAAVAEIMAGHAAPGHDYVLVARAATVKRPYAALVGDLETALRRLGVFCETPGAARIENGG